MPQTFAAYDAATSVNELTMLVRQEAQPMKAFSQAAVPPSGGELGKGKGDTVQYTFAPDVDTEGGILIETEDMPATGLTPIKATATLDELGNSIQFTGKLKDLNRLDLDDVHIAALINDYQKVMNSRAYDAAKTTDWKIAMSGTASSREFVTNGTLTFTQDSDLDLDNLGYITTRAEDQNIPKWDGESYLGIWGPDSIESASSDTTLSTLLSRDSGRDALNNEIGRVKQQRLVKDNHKVATSTGSFKEGFLLGADAVVKEVGQPVEVRREDRDYGRFLGLAWYEISVHFKVLDQTTHSREHIIHVTSA
jgi:hypothetical protein